MNILLTGGTGYVGSHTALALIEAGHKVVLYDNLVNSDQSILECLEKITSTKVNFIDPPRLLQDKWKKHKKLEKHST